MGVRYLTWFSKLHSVLREERVSNCTLVIDGDNLLWSIRNWFYNEGEGGGVYRNYARNVETFFCDLKRCSITPIVLLDGAYNPDCEKIPALLRGLQRQIDRALEDVYDEDAELLCSIGLIKTTFIEVLRRMAIPYAVCFFEADLPLAALARRLNCPVLSNDSDFMTVGVTSIKLPRRRARLELWDPQTDHSGFFMPCEVFRPQRLLRKFNVAEEMMPLIATLPGTEKYSRALFNDFFEKLDEQYQSVQREELRCLDLLMRWLADQTSLELALEQVLQAVPEDSRQGLEDHILKFNSSLDEVGLDFLRDTATMVLPAGAALAKDEGAAAAAPAVSTAAPDTSAAAPDTPAAAPPVSTAAPATCAASAAAPSTSTAAPDTSAAAPDTSAAAPDTSAAAPSASAAVPDTSTAAPDTSAAAPAASAAASAASVTAPDTSVMPPALHEFLKPPALRQATAQGSVPRKSIDAVYGLPLRASVTLEDPMLPCSSLAAVPLLTRLSALLGTPVGPLVLLTMHKGMLSLLPDSVTWRAPLLERVLLGGAADCLQTALTALQLRPGTLAALPPLLQLPVAALVVWRRATLGRSDRRQVRAVLLCLLALTPDDTPASELGLKPAAAADWRSWARPLRFVEMTERLFNLTAMHLYNEFQHVYQAVLNLNEVLGVPLAQLHVVNSLHIPMTMRLGFLSFDEGDVIQAGAQVEALVSIATDVVEAEVLWWQDVGYHENEPAGSVPWRPINRRDMSSEHADLRAARTLTGVLNKITDENAARMHETLRGMSVTTEYGLYTLVDTVCRRAVAEPSLVERWAEVCYILADMQVKSDRGDGTMVRFSDLLLTRLFLGVGPTSRLTIELEGDIEEIQDTMTDPVERTRQLCDLTQERLNSWSEPNGRQLAWLQLLAAVARRGLVPVWAARRCLARLLGGDGESREPPDGVIIVDPTLIASWVPEERYALAELLQCCNFGHCSETQMRQRGDLRKEETPAASGILQSDKGREAASEGDIGGEAASGEVRGAETASGEDRGAEVTSGEDRGAEAAPGEDIGGEAVSGEDRGAEAASGKDSGAEAASEEDRGGEATLGEDRGAEAASGEDRGGEVTSGEDRGAEAAPGEDRGAEAASGEDKGTEAASGEDKGTEAASGEDRGAEAASGKDRGGEAASGEDKGTEAASGEDICGDTASGEDRGGKTAADGEECGEAVLEKDREGRGGEAAS